ncbi:MAG: calcium/sodium antiporter [Sedimentisphaerales bacterium]|nr:calcium/sodium antiporter [Sedimentisphaerales bacterium]
MTWALLLLAGGLLLLWKGADLLVNGAVGIADRLGISQLIVGLTVVAMGTSAPEAAASIAAVMTDKGDIAIGNVFGSNIANLALVGGLVALIRPLQVQARTLRREIPTMLLVALLLWPALHGLTISRVEGVIFIAVFLGLAAYTIRTARTGEPPTFVDNPPRPHAVGRDLKRDLTLAVVGLAGLTVGARMAVSGAVTIGTLVGLSDAVVGSTIMAVGTSLPELVTCVLAALKGHHDISVGNLVGSNIFNTLLVTGIASVVRPFVVSARFANGPDYWIMIGVSLGFAATVILSRRVVGRVGGTVLLATYAGYLGYLLVFAAVA